LFIDTHTHLSFPEYALDRDEVIQRAKAKGIKFFIEVGTDLESSKAAVELAQEEEASFAAVGFHPHEASRLDEEKLNTIAQLAHKEKVVAVGEIGLDYYRNLSAREVQREAFRKQIRLANELGLPIIVHVRDAQQEALEILKNEWSSQAGGVLHCFSGNLSQAREAINLGLHIAFSGSITFNSSRLLGIMKELPLERILLETDSPYLAPPPFRGKRNEPAHLILIAQKMADTLELTLDDVARITTLNAMRLFGLGPLDKPKIAYQIRNSLYLNITNRCTNACIFCVRNFTDFVMGHNLRLEEEPTSKEILEAIGDSSSYKEVVFCGYGEPLLRLEVVKEVSQRLKEKGVWVRLNTNGQGNLIHKRNIVPELKGLIDEVCVSLNASNEQLYEKISPSLFGPDTYERVKEFILECKKFIPKVSITVVHLPELNLNECRRVAEELGVGFRVRKLNVVG